uniref:Bystin n=1 Tax=Noccaea caerulescens TaxID=107243 RepID=A0A1J3JYI3_NOCCA
MATKRRFKAISVASATPMKSCKSQKLTEKILKAAYEQQKEIEDEEKAEEIPYIASFKQAVYGLEDFTDDDEDNEQSQEFQSQLEYQDMANGDEEEEKLLLDAFFVKDGSIIAKRLSNAITSSIKELQDKDDVSTGSASVFETDYYQKLGKFMSMYTNGKMPKALNHFTKLDNWADLLRLTQPENWSPSAMYKATNMFASSTKAGRFFELFLLPRVRQDIKKNKKLHFCLYQSLKKTLFKPRGFYCGILIPLCKSGTCTLTEAVIIGSIMQKFSIPEVYSSAALVCLAEMKFLGTTSYFIKVILEKKYALAHLAVDAVAAHFLRFHKETRVMPVIWHQTLLAFVERYKHELRKEDKKSLTSLLKKQNHKLITSEIARELENSRNRGEKEGISPSASTINNKPIKEDWFDMPQVPMEED